MNLATPQANQSLNPHAPGLLEENFTGIETLLEHIQRLGPLPVLPEPCHDRSRHLLQDLQFRLELFNGCQDSCFFIKPIRHFGTFTTKNV